MRAYVERIAAEDRDADAVLGEGKLLDSPTKAPWTDLQRKKRLLTGGVIRRLCAHANSSCENKSGNETATLTGGLRVQKPMRRRAA